MTTRRRPRAGRARLAPVPSVSAFSAFVQRRMAERGLGKQALGDAVGMSRSAVYRLLGDTPPEHLPSERLAALARALDVDPAALAGLWGGAVHAVRSDDDRDAALRGFVLATGDLTLDELRAALDVAERAAALIRSRSATGRPAGAR